MKNDHVEKFEASGFENYHYSTCQIWERGSQELASDELLQILSTPCSGLHDSFDTTNRLRTTNIDDETLNDRLEYEKYWEQKADGFVTRLTYQRPARPTARARTARSTPTTRSHNTRPEKYVVSSRFLGAESFARGIANYAAGLEDQRLTSRP